MERAHPDAAVGIIGGNAGNSFERLAVLIDNADVGDSFACGQREDDVSRGGTLRVDGGECTGFGRRFLFLTQQAGNTVHCGSDAAGNLTPQVTQHTGSIGRRGQQNGNEYAQRNRQYDEQHQRNIVGTGRFHLNAADFSLRFIVLIGSGLDGGNPLNRRILRTGDGSILCFTDVA